MSQPLERASTAPRYEIDAAAIAAVLERTGRPLRARVIAQRLSDSLTTSVARRDVNQVLYRSLDKFSQNGNWEWSLDPFSPSPIQLVPEDDFITRGGFGAKATQAKTTWGDARLREWQRDALAAWSGHDERGIVRAVTGAGKTVVGLAAIARHISEPRNRAAVLVPSIALMDQWVRELSEWLKLPEAKIGRAGGAHSGRLIDSRVVVYVINSAARLLPKESRAVVDAGGSVLLVADECHRYGADTFRVALDGEYESTLGLTATAERPGDYGMEEVVLPALGDVVYDYGHREALDQGVISQFEVGFVGVEFNPFEREVYEDLSGQISKMAIEIQRQFPQIRRGKTYFADVQAELQRTGDPLLGGYVKRVSERRGLLGEVQGRTEFVEWLVRDVRQGARTFLFHETIAGAEWLADELNDAGVAAAAHHSGLDTSTRQAILGAFKNGALQAITAARTLDEGIDVPDASVAVIVYGSSVRRQRIQRIGRVLRPRPGKHARIVVVYVVGSREDPAARPEGDAFRNDIAELGRLRDFLWPHDSHALAEWIQAAGVGAAPVVRAPLIASHGPSSNARSLGIEFDLYNSGPG